MYCKCKEPKSVKSYVGKDVFEVCSKSKGGCGNEVVLKTCPIVNMSGHPIIITGMRGIGDLVADVYEDEEDFKINFDDYDIPFLKQKTPAERLAYATYLLQEGKITTPEEYMEIITFDLFGNN